MRKRNLPAEEKERRRRDGIPRSVAVSMAIAGQPMNLAWLEVEHRLLTEERRTLRRTTCRP